MEESFKLREVTKSDWKILLEWRNDKNTRRNSFNSDLISINTHKEFLNNAKKKNETYSAAYTRPKGEPLILFRFCSVLLLAPHENVVAGVFT